MLGFSASGEKESPSAVLSRAWMGVQRAHEDALGKEVAVERTSLPNKLKEIIKVIGTLVESEGDGLWEHSSLSALLMSSGVMEGLLMMCMMPGGSRKVSRSSLVEVLRVLGPERLNSLCEDESFVNTISHLMELYLREASESPEQAPSIFESRLCALLWTSGGLRHTSLPSFLNAPLWMLLNRDKRVVEGAAACIVAASASTTTSPLLEVTSPLPPSLPTPSDISSPQWQHRAVAALRVRASQSGVEKKMLGDEVGERIELNGIGRVVYGMGMRVVEGVKGVAESLVLEVVDGVTEAGVSESLKLQVLVGLGCGLLDGIGGLCASLNDVDVKRGSKIAIDIAKAARIFGEAHTITHFITAWFISSRSSLLFRCCDNILRTQDDTRLETSFFSLALHVLSIPSPTLKHSLFASKRSKSAILKKAEGSGETSSPSKSTSPTSIPRASMDAEHRLLQARLESLVPFALEDDGEVDERLADAALAKVFLSSSDEGAGERKGDASLSSTPTSLLETLLKTMTTSIVLSPSLPTHVRGALFNATLALLATAPPQLRIELVVREIAPAASTAWKAIERWETRRPPLEDKAILMHNKKALKSWTKTCVYSAKAALHAQE